MSVNPVDSSPQLATSASIERMGGGWGPGGDRSAQSSAITTWVESHYTPITVDGVTLYDLTAAPSA